MVDTINIIIMILVLLGWILIIWKLIISKCTTIKTVGAKVIDKYKPDIASVYSGSFKPKRYIIVFETKGKKLSFNVSEFSYKNYELNETGILQYKGTKLIGFDS